MYAHKKKDEESNGNNIAAAAAAANMDAIDSVHDVIFISSSDNDSDCRIVKVVPSPIKRGKNKLQWQNKPSSKTQTSRTSRKSREMTIHQLNEAVYEDRQDMASTPREYAKRLNTDLMATRRDAARNGGLQGTNQSVNSLRCGSKTDHLSDTGSKNTQTSRDAIRHVDLEDRFAIQQYTADLSPANTSSPSLQSVEFKQELQHHEDEDEQRSARSRSGSTATLDFSPEEPVAQLDSCEGLGKDAQGIVGMLDGPSETTEPIGATRCTSLNAREVISHSSDYPTPSRESSLEKSDPAVLPEKVQDGKKTFEKDYSFEPANTLQNHGSPSRCQLPRVGRWPAWNSVINVAAFEAMPGPLFTRPKQALDAVTYEAVMEERAKQDARKRKRKYSDVVSC